MSETLFRLTRVRRRLGEGFLLDIDDLSIGQGEVTALVGPTGAGKTTLLRLLTGLERPDEGSIHLNGAPLNGGSPLAMFRDIAMVHQRPILIAGSVTDNIAYGMRARRRASAAAVGDMLKRLGLDRLAAQEARTLSGGQTQLVGLARALVLQPKVLLLDEPTANLDPAHVGLVESVIGEAQSRRKMTVVWATHNLFQARRVSTQAILILNGRVVEVGDNETFFASPKDARTAAFVEGKMVY
jgi:tungstate transport system ATP-binding protein